MTNSCLCGKSIIDLAVIGAGPAGLTAGLYGNRAGLHTVIFGDPYEGQLARAGTVENFPTWTGSPTGLSIVEKLVEHNSEVDAELVETKVKQLIRDEHDDHNVFSLALENGESVCAYSVVLSTGTKHKKLGIAGEEEFYGNGVGYCTVCDGPLYKDKPVAILGFGDECMVAALRMTSIASEVHVVSSKTLIGGDPALREELENEANVTLYERIRPLAIIGSEEKGVNGLKVKQGEVELSIDVDAVFIEVGVLPATAIASGLGVELDRQFIKVNKEQETNVAGFFAAGDIAGGKSRQAVISAGDGARAAINAIDYIKKLGVSQRKLKTTQWGGSKAKKKQVTDTSMKSGTLNQYVQSDEGFLAAYNRYYEDKITIGKFLGKIPGAKLITVSAHWCPDCRRNVPKMAKIVEHLTWNIEVHDRDEEGIKEKYNIRKIPTFIIQNAEGEEIARIIENPKYGSLEEDLLAICENRY